MKILVFGTDFKCDKYEYKYVKSEEEFFDEIIFRDYDILIIDFNYLEAFLEVKNYFKGIIIFIHSYVDEFIYKKALELGDYFYLNEEIWKIPYRLKYIKEKFFHQKSNVFIYKDLIFNLKTKELYKNREIVKISPAKKDILALLIKNKNKFISKEYILENSENIDNISSIKVLISKLRKLGFNIENQKDLGYKLKIKETK